MRSPLFDLIVPAAIWVGTIAVGVLLFVLGT